MKRFAFLFSCYIGLLLVQPLFCMWVNQPETELKACTSEGCCIPGKEEENPCQPTSCCGACNPFQVCGLCCVGNISQAIFYFQKEPWVKISYPILIERYSCIYLSDCFRPPEKV